MNNKRIKIFTGHFGSGKTEIAVNYAAEMLSIIRAGGRNISDTTGIYGVSGISCISDVSGISGNPGMPGILGIGSIPGISGTHGADDPSIKSVVIADLDIVNPYFRTADARDSLEKIGVKTIIPMYAGTNADVPALPARINTIFEDRTCAAILDVGGDDTGARVLSVYKDRIEASGYELFLVVNTRRPETSTEDGIIAAMKAIEKSSRLKVTGIVNNTNLLSETTADIIADGRTIIDKASAKTGVPVAFTAVMRETIKASGTEPQIRGPVNGPIYGPVLYLRKYIKLPF